jgi:glutamyl-tRNA synthetase
MMSNAVRVRFAPSPTGLPHVGNIRTALFNWLFARHSKGQFIVRIEDTDVARWVKGAIEAILESLHWLELDWDEGPEVGGEYGPYFQSQRLDIYRVIAQQLVKQGDAYLCYCSPERLEQMRAEQMRRKVPPGYDRRCRNLSARERVQLEIHGIIPVIRFKTPLDGETRFDDLIRGQVVFDNRNLDDFVLLKSDGYPTYHLANVVDDHLMEISHVLRADEWLASTPRHVLLYEALDYQPPLFAHLPMILGPDRSKLSKRHGAVSILDYREQGYPPEAVINFLALLGWSLDDRTEIISREQLVRDFSLERIAKTGAIFNIDKLNWMSGVYIRQLNAEEFLQRVLPFLEAGLPQGIKRPLSTEYVQQMAPLIQERITTLGEAAEYAEFFFVQELDYDPALLTADLTAEAALEALQAANKRLQRLDSFDASSLEGLLRPLASELGLKTGEFFGLLRVATTGRTAAPPLFQTMAILGKERCLKRIEAALRELRGRV